MSLSLGPTTIGPVSIGKPQGTPVPVVPRTCVLLALGQSNMVDQSPADTTIAWPGNALVMDTENLSYSNPGTATLKWFEVDPGTSGDWQLGPGQQVKHFARHWCAAHPADTLIVIPAARGGTGFMDGAWTATGTGRMYNETLRLLDQLLIDHPGAELEAVLVQNGESDANLGNVLYEFDLLTLMADLRTRYGAATLPITVGEMGAAPQFTANIDADHQMIRSHLRHLPTVYPFTANARASDPEGFDALTSVGDGLHFDQAAQKSLGTLGYQAWGRARLNGPTTQPDVALVWQSHDGGNWDDFDFVCGGVTAGDTLVVMTAANLSASAPLPTAMAIEGEPMTLHLTQSIAQERNLGLSVASVTLSATPATDLLNLTATWSIAPAGGALSIWRVRGGLPVDASRIAWAADQTGASMVATPANAQGPIAVMNYAVNSTGAITFAAPGEALAYGPGGRPSTYFATHQAATGPITVTPSGASDKVCGLIAVALGPDQ